MSKTSTYKNPAYVLSFGVNDILTLDIEIEITLTGDETRQTFDMVVKKAQLNEKEMEVACYLVKMLTVEGLKKLNNDIEVALRNELTPNLFSLFYVGDV